MTTRERFIAAQEQGKTVSFVYAARDGKRRNRFGTVDHVGTEHVVIFDTVHSLSVSSRLDCVESLEVF